MVEIFIRPRWSLKGEFFDDYLNAKAFLLAVNVGVKEPWKQWTGIRVTIRLKLGDDKKPLREFVEFLIDEQYSFSVE